MEALLTILEDLGTAEFKTFKWYLTQPVLESFPSIPVSRLENAERTDVVDKMVQTYNLDGAARITVAVLKKMNQNSLAFKLENGI
ncbi:hypothetical protein DPEC_G00320340 [Dallia pectoralis]|uniref:Uncharacterized protein n=1 Tax=Dallia pectoralis TaxID=75939 RepID=A0ACC2F9R9_DALPE|nr:hypothetical protein DPEC_G00320340 [Dallia pectoralis]